MRYARLGAALLLMAILPALVSCSKQTTKVKDVLGFDTYVKLTFRVSSDVNPDGAGRPSPLILRYYELKSPTLFERANFLDLFENDKEVLGADLIRRHDVKRLVPGLEEHVEDAQISDEAQYIAVYAEFTRYQNSDYYLLIPVKPHSKTKKEILITGTSLRLVQ